jgi:uncharacterized protein YidB (DUF937 family)
LTRCSKRSEASRASSTSSSPPASATKAKSWIGVGPNESIDADDVKSALGGELDELAQKLGMSKDDAAEEVAQNLRDAVDKATPNGSLAEAEGASKAAGAVTSPSA